MTAAQDGFRALVDEVFDATLRFSPGTATARGFHQYDDRLTDASAEAVRRRTAELRDHLARAEALDAAALPPEEARDLRLLRSQLRYQLRDLEELRPFARSPMTYLGIVSGACDSLVRRSFAPAPERLRSLIARERLVPELLTQGRAGVEPDLCTTIHAETALEQLAGLRLLFTEDLPRFAAEAGDAAARRDFEDANARVLAALDGYGAWIRETLLPRAAGQIALGRERFEILLRDADMITLPAEELVRRAREDLSRTQALLRETAERIQPGAPVAEVVDRVSAEHPTADDLIPESEACLEDLRRFCVEQGLVTMPTDEPIRVEETPGYYRYLAQAACSTPGPFEDRATEAFYWVTRPAPDWDAERREGYLRFFNRYAIPLIGGHEVYPGHYVHLTWLRKADSRVGRFFPNTTTIEGWAHYCEQVLIEAGYGGGDPRYHLMQLREALLRLCRYLAAFGLHTEGWSFQDAVEFFVREGYATRVIAEREARRGVLSPSYYAYTLGKHEILALRERLRTRLGSRFNLQAFHNRVMQLPYPVPIIADVLSSEAA